MRRQYSGVWLIILLNYSISVFAQTATDTAVKSVIMQLDEPTVISLYEPNYLFPFYYTQAPYYSIYENSTPDQQRINKLETSFQISFKVPVWHIMPDTKLYAAYTQVSFWQLYNSSPFFRETDYQPELYVEHKLDWPLFPGWRLKFLNTGAVHASNGRGGELERSWNRVYADGIFANENWMVSIKPWYVLHDAAIGLHNPGIANYMGYGRELIAYKINRQEFSLQTRNVLESNFKRGAVQLNWSFPLLKHVRGYMRGFSGYGQSLIEYNHYTNSAGVGIALNDWI